MSRLTLRLPETLHQQLANLAKSEGVSLNQYIVYALTRQITAAAQLTPNENNEKVAQQERAFLTLLEELGHASPTEIESVLNQRDVVRPEDALSPEIVARFQQRLRDGANS